MSQAERQLALAKIRENIDSFGYHVYVVAGAPVPRFVYTIGLTASVGAELVFAGGALFATDQVLEIIAAARVQIATDRGFSRPLSVGDRGHFTFQRVHDTWSQVLLLGALDYYAATGVAAFQCVPDAAHVTVDVPDLSVARDENPDAIWRWLTETWPYPVSRNSRAMTNLAALRGERITEVTRWEEEYWEMFAGAGPDVTEGDARSVPLATLLGADISLTAALDLRIGDGIWRDAHSGDWNRWQTTSTESS